MRSSCCSVAAAALALAVLSSTAFAQGVGINSTGAAADTSALLDLSSTAKGFLAPRMTALQRAAIFSPATGLLVYQTDGTAGLYYNAGSSVAPLWKQLVDSGASSGGPWQASGQDLFYSAGRVGVGAASFQACFTVVDTLNGLRVQTDRPGGALASFGSYGTFAVDAPGVVGGRLTLLDNGMLGIGNPAPTNPLSFANTEGKKISLYHDGSGGDFGLGIENARTKIYSGNASADVAIGYDNVGTFVEKFTVKPTGALAVNGSAGATGQVLQSNGAAAAATWVSPTNAAFNNIYSSSSTTAGIFLSYVLPGQIIPGLEIYGIPVASNAKFLVNYTVSIYAGTPSPIYDVKLLFVLDGASVTGSTIIIDQDMTNTPHITASGMCLIQGVPPGTHSVQVLTQVSGGTAANGVAMFGSMIIQVIQQ
jgi:hypothetical protein